MMIDHQAGREQQMNRAGENVMLLSIHLDELHRRKTDCNCLQWPRRRSDPLRPAGCWSNPCRMSAPLRWPVVPVLVMLMIFSSGGAETAIAGEVPSTQPAPVTKPAPVTATVPEPQPAPEAAPAKPEEQYPAEIFNRENTPEDRKKVDKVHDRIERGILGEVVRLDSFFGDLKSDDERKTGYLLQVRNFVRVEKGGGVSVGPSLRANVTLSRISNRLRLYISGDNGPEPIAPRLPEDPGNPGFDRPAVTAKVVNTELRYELFQTPSTNMFLGAGVRLAIPAEAFVRSRIQHTRQLNDVTLLRLGETLFVNNIVALGETTEISLERILDSKNLLRWDTAGTVSSGVAGLEWGTELSLLHLLSSKSTITLTGGVYGSTKIDDMITNYRLLARYRRNFLRSWLFYELVPELSWPRQVNGLFPANYAMTFILEVSFTGITTGRDK